MKELDRKIKEVRKTIDKERHTAHNDRWNYLNGLLDGLGLASNMVEYEETQIE
jgi:hypothetical protein